MSAVAEAIQAPSTNGAGPLMGSPSQQHHETAVADWLTVDPDQKFEETETELDLSNCEAKRVAAVIAHTAKFACKDTSRPVLMRLLCYADGQCLKFEATNSYMLAVIGANVEGKDGLGSFNFPFQIEGANATEIAKTLKKVGRFDRAKLSLNWGEGDFGSLEATVGTATARAQVSRNNAYGTFPDTQMLIKTALDRGRSPGRRRSRRLQRHLPRNRRRHRAGSIGEAKRPILDRHPAKQPTTPPRRIRAQQGGLRSRSTDANPTRIVSQSDFDFADLQLQEAIDNLRKASDAVGDLTGFGLRLEALWRVAKAVQDAEQHKTSIDL